MELPGQISAEINTAETKGWANNIGKYVSIAYLEAEQAQF